MMKRRRLSGVRATLLAGCAVMTSAAADAAASARSNADAAEFDISAPEDFADLEEPHEMLVDVYFGGRRVGEARIVSNGGTIRFKDPQSVAALIPNLADQGSVLAELSGDVPANAALVCSTIQDSHCATLNPEVAGVIHDSDRFRVDLFVNPRLLAAVSAGPKGFLERPSSRLSLASSVGFSLSGNVGEAPLYHVQTRNIVGFGSARLRSNLAVATDQGMLIDDFVAELDRPDERWSAGLFWAPGSDFTGERRILGLGFGTQLDTRLDKDELEGTPLYLFLQRSARVEVLVDGRLVDSRLYDAGNNILDTSALPSGSYNLLLRIQEGGGPVREERRFFVRGTQMAPLGRPLFHVAAGFLANSRPGHVLSLSKQLYYRADANIRLSRVIGIHGGITGTQDKLLGEAGLFLATKLARVHASALGSSAGDSGALFQVSSSGLGRIQFTFDLRRVHSRSGQPLLPLPVYGESFGSVTSDRTEWKIGSYTQVTGNVGWQVGDLSLQVTGYYRGDGKAYDYSIGPSASWQLVQMPGMQVTLLADAQKNRGGLSGFVGARVLGVRGPFSTVSTAGTSFSRRNEKSAGRPVGSLTAQWDVQPWDNGRMAISAGFERSDAGTTAQSSATLQSRFGNARGDLIHRFGGPTSYMLNFTSGGAITGGSMMLGGRNFDESALIASVRGTGGNFELLVDNVPRGRVEAGGKLPLFLRPYRAYQVKLRPLDAGAIDVDIGSRAVTLYPGSVEHVVWQAEKLLTVFGRLVDVRGRPIADATIEGRREPARSDSDGWFQIDVAGAKPLRFTQASGGECIVALDSVDTTKDYVSLGDVTCR